MEEPQRLTLASTWRFDNEGAREVQIQFKATPKGNEAFCKYESMDDVFVVDCDGTEQPIVDLGHLIVSFIEDEKDNDLLDKLRISRIVTAAAGHDESLDEDSETEGELLDLRCAIKDDGHMMPITIEYWRTQQGGIECFAKSPFDILAQVSKLSGADVFLDEDNNRLRVTSSLPDQVRDALQKLSNIAKSFSLIACPHVTNILNVGDNDEHRLRFPVYRTLNELALSRVLVDPECESASRLFNMFVTLLVFINAESQFCEMPDNVRTPPRPTEPRKGRSKLWVDFKFQGLGDLASLPKLGGNRNPVAEAVQENQLLGNNPLPEELARGAPGDEHPFLTQEKASVVNRWVSGGIEAGVVSVSGSEPDGSPPPQASADSVPRPKSVPGKKIRRVAPGNANPLVCVIAPTTHEQRALNPEENLIAREAPAVSRSFITHDFGSAKLPSIPQARPSAKHLQNPQPTMQKTFPPLVDVSNSITAMPATNMPLVLISQEPLIPSQTAQKGPYSAPALLAETGINLAPCRDRSGCDAAGKITSALEVRMPPEVLSRTEEDQSINAAQYPASHDPANHEVKSDTPQIPTRIAEREQETVEFATRMFHRIMGQRTSRPQNKTLTKAEQRAKKQAAIAEAWDIPLTLLNAPSATSGNVPEQSDRKKGKRSRAEDVHPATLKDFFASLEPVLDAARYFAGSISVELQFGLILIYSLPKVSIESTFEVKSWNTLFRPEHNLRPPSTKFINRLTTSGADIDYVIGLRHEGAQMFSEEPTARYIQYEFHCQTKTNEIVIISVDESGVTFVNRPACLLGAVNIHCPGQIWDIAAMVKGVLEYTPGFDVEVDNAVQALIDNLYIPSNRSKIMIYTRISGGNELRVMKVLMKRSTRHRYLVSNSTSRNTPDLYAPPSGKMSITLAESHSGDAENLTNGPECPLIEKGVYLQVTEVQNLFFGHPATDKTVVRARALSPEAMVGNDRLWYEVSLVSPAIEEILKANRDLEVGDCVNSWCASDLLGYDAFLGLTQENHTIPKPLTGVVSKTGSAGLCKMFRVANAIVEKIDGAGWANFGPGVEAAEHLSLISPVIPRHSRSPGVGAGAAPAGFRRIASTAISSAESVKNMESVSVRNALVVEASQDEFW